MYDISKSPIKKSQLGYTGFSFDEELDKWTFTLNSQFLMFYSEVDKQVLIGTLDSIILLLFVKWTISDALLPLKHNLVLKDTCFSE